MARQQQMRTIMKRLRTSQQLGILRRCLQDRAGVSAVLVALMMIPIVGSVGLAINSSVGFTLKSRLSKSLDAAALAGGRVALSDNAEEIARQYFDANFGPTDGIVSLDDFHFELDESKEFVTLTAQATTPTYFMRIFGKDAMTVNARTVIQRQTTGMELALVMDITGSMRGSKFAAMKQASQDLVDIIFGDRSEIENLWVSLVPYVASVNIGPSRKNWLKTNDEVLKKPSAFDPEGWRGCVMARANPFDTDDTPPAAQPFTSYRYPKTSDTADNNYPPVKNEAIYDNLARGPNLACGAPIMGLTASKSVIDGALDAMLVSARGGTTSNLGLSWGWRTLSPRWRGLWGGTTPATHPLDYHTENMEKVIVILTDGQNQFHDNSSSNPPYSDFTAYGRLDNLGTTNKDEGRKILDSRMSGTCTAMKSAGIRIYTITFGSGIGSSTQALFSSCASEPSMYFHAPSNEELRSVFHTIAGELANLRIYQ